jgi:hypothetical protein
MAMESGSRKSNRVRSLLRDRLWMVPAALSAPVLLYFTLPDEAQSQINGRVTKAPFSAAVHTSSSASASPKAPVQVELPPAPPMRYVPGLEEPLVATGPVTDAESRELDAALAAYHEAPLKLAATDDFSDYAKPLLAFMKAHPQSNWNAALLLDLGLGYYHSGYFSKAFSSYELSWKFGRNATSVEAHLMIDRAVAELAEMHVRVGHSKELQGVMDDIGNRPSAGPRPNCCRARAADCGYSSIIRISAICAGPRR